MDGFLLVNKPAGPTSFAIVKRIRALCKGARTGHAGTLDPAASGLLIIGVGGATRLLQYLPLEPKRYEFTVVFGIETDTLDEEGAVVRSGGSIPTLADIQSVLPRFIGRLMQQPPRYSAVKTNGRRAYVRARNNETFSLRARPVFIHAITVRDAAVAENQIRFEVSCSSGTYVRALAGDIASALGTWGHASCIARTAAGPFTLTQAVDVTSLAAPMEERLIPPRTMVSSSACITLTPAQRQRVALGADISLDMKEAGEGPLFAFDDGDSIVAVLTKNNNGEYHPVKVFL